MQNAYANSFHDPGRAAGYQGKFRRGVLRRWSHRRELRCLERALEATGDLAAGRVWDVPCGAGRFTRLLAGRARHYLGLDNAHPMARLAAASGVEAVQASAWALPAVDRAVDLVVCIRLSHHVREGEALESLVAELCRVARGAVILSFMDRSAFKQRVHRIKRGLARRPLTRPMWSRASLAAAARRCGFAVHRFYPLSSLFSGQTLALLVREERP